MKTLADIKRTVQPGVTFYCENYLHPHLSGNRTVTKAQTNGMYYTLPDGREGWFEYPKAKATNEYVIHDHPMELTMLNIDGSAAFMFTFA